MILSRRRILTGLLAAPIVVRAGLLMPVKAAPRWNTLLIDNGARASVNVVTLTGLDKYGNLFTETVLWGSWPEALRAEKNFLSINDIVWEYK